MSKISIKTSLKYQGEITNYDVNGIKNINKIMYQEDNYKVTIIINKDSIKLIRKNKEIMLEIEFINNKKVIGYYTLLDGNNKLELDIYTKKLIIQDTYIEIEYELNDETRIYIVNF